MLSWAGTTFSVDQTNSNKIVAKAIAKTSLEVVPATMPVATATDLSASYYVLWDPATGKVLTGVKEQLLFLEHMSLQLRICFGVFLLLIMEIIQVLLNLKIKQQVSFN